MANVKGVQKRLEKDAEGRARRRGMVAGIGRFPSSYRNKFRREFLLMDRQKERRKMFIYLAVVGVLLFLFLVNVVLTILS